MKLKHAAFFFYFSDGPQRIRENKKTDSIFYASLSVWINNHWTFPSIHSQTGQQQRKNIFPLCMLYVQFMLTFITMTGTVVQYKPWSFCPRFLQLPYIPPKFYLLLLCGDYLLIKTKRHNIYILQWITIVLLIKMIDGFFTKLWLYKKLLVEENKKCAVDTARHRYEDNVKNGSKGSEVAEKWSDWRSWDFVMMGMNFWVPYQWGISLQSQ